MVVGITKFKKENNGTMILVCEIAEDLKTLKYKLS